jgi:Flp pilus assembly protein TadG
MSYIKRFKQDETGAAMVEFAIVFVFLFLPLMFGALEFGRATWIKQSVTAAAREGVRYAIVHGSASGALPTDTAAISTWVLSRSRLSPLSITTTFTPASTNTPGSLVKVQVSYSYVPVIGNFTATLGGRTVRIPLLSARPITSASQQVIAY